MAYATPTSHSSGEVVTATEWNVLVDDILETPAAKFTAKGDQMVASGANATAKVAVSGTKGSAWVEDSSATNGVKWQTPQAVRAIRSSNQSIANATSTAIQFNAADEIDTNSMHDIVTNNTRLIAVVKGVYLIGGEMVFAAAAAVASKKAQIVKNGGGALATARDIQPSSSDTSEVQITTLAELNASDYVELTAFQNTGGAVNVTAAKFWMILQYLT